MVSKGLLRNFQSSLIPYHIYDLMSLNLRKLIFIMQILLYQFSVICFWQ